MKNITFLFSLLLAAITFGGCEFLGDIFKAGIWVGVIAVILILLIVVWLIRKFKG